MDKLTQIIVLKQRYRQLIKCIILVIAFIFGLGKVLVMSVSADDALIDPAGEPNIIFEEYLYDFGQADRGETITHIYKFKNSGKKKLIISKVRSSCGCMAALLSDKEIPPGGTGQVEVKFDTGRRRGKQMHTVYVHSNDPDEPLVKLNLSGTVKTYVTISPTRIYLGSIRKGKGTIKRINIFEGEEGLKIIKTEPSSKYLFAEVFQMASGKGGDYEVIVALSPETPIGPIKEQITIYTNNLKRPRIEILIRGEVKGDIEIFPKSLLFGSVKKKDTPSRQVIILTRSSGDLKIEKVENSIQSISVQLSPLEKGKKYVLTAQLKPDMPEGSIKGVVKLYTNSADQPVIEVPVYGLVQE